MYFPLLVFAAVPMGIDTVLTSVAGTTFCNLEDEGISIFKRMPSSQALQPYQSISIS
jgi:hypothetical protein